MSSRPYKCPYPTCRSAFTDQKRLLVHIDRFHGEAKMLPDYTVPPRTVFNLRVPPIDADEFVPLSSAISAEIVLTASGKVSKESDRPKCSTCNGDLYSSHDLYLHISVHEDDIAEPTCHGCNERFGDVDSLYTHRVHGCISSSRDSPGHSSSSSGSPLREVVDLTSD